MPFFTKQLNPDAVVIELLYLLGSPIATTEIINELNIHPDYPNLLALNDVLNNFGIESAAYRINCDELPDVPCPFIAHTRKQGSEYLLIKSLDSQTVVVTDQKKRNYKISFKEFENIFAGVILVPEDIQIAETTNLSSFHFDQIRYPVLMAFALVLLFAGTALIGSSPLSWRFITLKVFGLNNNRD